MQDITLVPEKSTTSDSAIVRYDHAGPLDVSPEAFRSGLDRRKENRKSLMEWIRSALVEGVDFGSIPTKRGPSKPSLWKPGAEKICGMLGVTVTFPTLREYEQVALKGIEIKNVVLRCDISDSRGVIVAEGIGARSLAQDYGDLNKALKMAEKSAHIDATLRMAGLSELFSQDLEDLPKDKQQNLTPSNRPQDKKWVSGVTPAAKTPPTPTAATPAPVKNNAPPPPRKVQEAIFADADTRKRMIIALTACNALAVEYFSKLTNPTILLPGEGLEDVPLRFVPITRNQMKALQDRITDFGNGLEATHAFPANPEPPVKDKPPQPPSAKTGEVKGSSVVDAVKAKDPEWFWDVIISVPRKGMKKADYDRKPDTIGSLYHSMKSGDQDEGRRLWGLVNHFDPQPREHNGRTFQPSEADHTTRKALDAFAEYEEKHKNDTGHGERAEANIQQTGSPEPVEPPGGWQGATEPAPYEDDVPF